MKTVYNYPLKFKSTKLDLVVEFISLNKGTVVKTGKDSPYELGHYDYNWIEHTNTNCWQPCQKETEKLDYDYDELVEVLYKQFLEELVANTLHEFHPAIQELKSLDIEGKKQVVSKYIKCL